MPLQFRVALNKRPQSEPRFVVMGGPRPVRACFGEESGTGAFSKEKLMQSFAREVFEGVVQKYIIYATAMRKGSRRELKKGKVENKTLLILRGRAKGGGWAR